MDYVGGKKVQQTGAGEYLADGRRVGAGFIAQGGEIKIKDLVDLIVKLTGFKGKIVWDTTKPDGQPRRSLDTTVAWKEFGFKAIPKLRDEEGSKKSIDWYINLNPKIT